MIDVIVSVIALPEAGPQRRVRRRMSLPTVSDGMLIKLDARTVLVVDSHMCEHGSHDVVVNCQTVLGSRPLSSYETLVGLHGWHDEDEKEIAFFRDLKGNYHDYHVSVPR